jgi:hypothetical protein
MPKATHPVDAAVLHIVATLPDSLRARRAILELVLNGVPADYPHRDWLLTLSHSFDAAERDQLKFIALLSGAHDGGGK